jgi:hypothetical protein
MNIVTEEENTLRNKFFLEAGEKAYTGHIEDGDKVVWKEEYVKWLEKIVINLKSHKKC